LIGQTHTHTHRVYGHKAVFHFENQLKKSVFQSRLLSWLCKLLIWHLLPLRCNLKSFK